LYLNPANLFVAGFIGRLRMNLLPVRHAAGAAVLEGNGFVLPLPASARRALDGHGDLMVGFRPETIEVHRHAAADRCQAAVDTVQFQGDRLICGMRLGAELIHVSLDAREQLAAGATVWLSVASEQLHLFDRANGRRLSGETSVVGKASKVVN